MPQDKFLIAPINSGIQRDVKPWLILDDSFEMLENAYAFRGRLRKRPGARLMAEQPYQSRLRILLGTTSAGGDFNATVPGDKFLVGQQFTIGTQILTVIALGAPAALLDTGGSLIATFNTTTGVFDVVDSPNVNTSVYYYPAQPVMGLDPYENEVAINSEPFYAFDTQFAYKFFATGWERSGTLLNPIWHGDDLDFFWTSSWQGATPNLTAFFVTNFQVTNPNGVGTATDDPLWYTQDGSTWAGFFPYFNPAGAAPQNGPFVLTSRLIIAFKDRLLLLNTIENDGTVAFGVNTHYPNRCRFCFNGSPFAVNAWYEPNVTDNAGGRFAGGGWIDATTDEEIISAEFIKDRLIVYFERSTWELVYTHNQVQPFLWQKLNTELGVESTFSVVPFDKAVLGMGNVGVHACNGSNVERIDFKIPDQVFDISNANFGIKRTCGARDYFTELVYWSFRSVGNTFIYPNQILAFNYRNSTWALFDDCITTFGAFNQQPSSTWSNMNLTWGQANMTWGSGSIASLFSQVVAGNQEGYTFIVDSNVSRNAPVLQITNMADDVISFNLQIMNHTLAEGEYIAIEGAQGVEAYVNDQGYNVAQVIDANHVLVTRPDIGGHTAAGYTGGGQVTRLSAINILSKQYNPYIDTGHNFSINKIDFAVMKTSHGEIEVDYTTSSSYYSTVANDLSPSSFPGTNTLETTAYPLYPFEQLQTRLWHTVYFDTQGECIQLKIFLAPDQLFDLDIAWEDFQLEGMMLYVQPTGRVE
jgi:hypothetical protein